MSQRPWEPSLWDQKRGSSAGGKQRPHPSVQSGHTLGSQVHFLGRSSLAGWGMLGEEAGSPISTGGPGPSAPHLHIQSKPLNPLPGPPAVLIELSSPPSSQDPCCSGPRSGLGREQPEAVGSDTAWRWSCQAGHRSGVECEKGEENPKVVGRLLEAWSIQDQLPSAAEEVGGRGVGAGRGSVWPCRV